jgi:hypothetical protein
VIACIGDGAMQMLGINALIDVAYHWQRWSNPQLVCSCSTTTTSTRSPGSSAC